MKSIICLLALIFICIPATIFGEDEFVLNGEAWNQIDKESEIFYLAGYLKGAYRGMMVGLQDIECVNHKEVASKAQQKYRSFIGKGNMQILLNEIERVYQAKANHVIEVDEVIVFALKKAEPGFEK